MIFCVRSGKTDVLMETLYMVQLAGFRNSMSWRVFCVWWSFFSIIIIDTFEGVDGIIVNK